MAPKGDNGARGSIGAPERFEAGPALITFGRQTRSPRRRLPFQVCAPNLVGYCNCLAREDLILCGYGHETHRLESEEALGEKYARQLGGSRIPGRKAGMTGHISPATIGAEPNWTPTIRRPISIGWGSTVSAISDALGKRPAALQPAGGNGRDQFPGLSKAPHQCRTKAIATQHVRLPRWSRPIGTGAKIG